MSEINGEKNLHKCKMCHWYEQCKTEEDIKELIEAKIEFDCDDYYSLDNEDEFDLGVQSYEDNINTYINLEKWNEYIEEFR
jgi:hypothetical protein